MISFEMLSSYARAFFALWALLLCVVNISSAAVSVFNKRYHITVVSLVSFAPCYFLWQVIFDFSLLSKTGEITEITSRLIEFPVLIWFGSLIVFSLLSAILLERNISYDKNYITRGTIKTHLDKIPCGICCWRENGRILFSNICMNELCLAITGAPLLNGQQFKNAVKDGILTVDEKVWRFTCREISLDGESLFEMIASDITAEYSKTRALEEDKAKLSRLNQELWNYYLSIDESVQKREILQAKMSIHDEMNRLMLSTVAADKNDSEALDNIFSLWEQNALLLCMEADKKPSQRNSIDSLANALDIKLIWNEKLPTKLNDAQKEFFFFTAQEALINAVKHAQAKTLEITFESIGDSLLCRFTNDGKLPNEDVSFQGGLANIAMLAKKQGAEVYTEVGEEFSLVLRFSN